MKHKRITYIFVLIAVLLLGGCGKKQDNTDINKLIASGENEKVIEMVNNGYDINANVDSPLKSIATQNEVNNCSPLYMACQSKNYDMIKFLLDNGADPNYSGYGLEYPFEVFMSKSYTDIDAFKLFLEKGADIEKHNIKIPLCALLSHYSKVDTAKQEIIEQEVLYLIDNGVIWRNDNLKEQYGGYSILHFVAATNRVEFMKTLLEYDEAKECLNSATNTGETPYDIAKANNQNDMCNILKQER